MPATWIVVIPARLEGAGIARTVESIAAAQADANVRTIVILDGDDPASRDALAATRAEIALKEPPGPSKAAALTWFADVRASDLATVDALLVLDVGSTLSAQFFSEFRWPDDAAAAQAFISARAEGVGLAAGSSERVAQQREDAGRERLGWPVRLRGTGMVLRPQVAADIFRRLVTQAEDEEATLLLSAAGRRIVLAPSEASVVDEKPSRARDASAQRARWLAGRTEIVVRQPRAIATLIVRSPLQGISFVLNLLGRPLSLTVPLRIVSGLAIVALSLRRSNVAGVVGGAVIAFSGALDTAQVLGSGVPLRSAAQLAASWFAAVPLVPKTVAQWLRVRRP